MSLPPPTQLSLTRSSPVSRAVVEWRRGNHKRRHRHDRHEHIVFRKLFPSLGFLDLGIFLFELRFTRITRIPCLILLAMVAGEP